MFPDAVRRSRPAAAALLLAVLAACGALTPRTPYPRLRAHVPAAPAFDVLSYALDIELLPAQRAVEAECRVRLAALDEPLREVRLDLVGLEVQGVRDGAGRALAYEHEGEVLAVRLGAPLAPGAETEVVVAYGGVPRVGLWWSGTRDDGSGPTQVFSHGQTEGSRGWFPCVDVPSERASTELVVTLPAGWELTATGERVEAREEGGRRVERWRMDFPHPAYLTSLAAGELVVVEGRAGDVPLTFLAEPRFAEWIEPTFAETDEILAFLEDFTGIPYPYAKYSQAAVDNFPWGGMENISATTLTPTLLGDEALLRDQPSFFLVAHEAAHQWFGDLFTCADWSHLWLNEGFATYLTLLYLEHTRGRDEFRARLRETQEEYLRADVGDQRRPTVWNVWREPDDVFDTRPYQGGAARLHLLRFVLGDEAFQRGVRAYAARNVGRGVVTEDLRRALEESSGRDLGTFFRQWLLSPGYPELVTSWEWDADEREVRLRVEQRQSASDGTPAVFELPLDVEVRTARGVRTHRVELDERRERFRLPADERPLYVHLDPGGWIPKRLWAERAPAEWRALLASCEDVNARREAALALGHLAARGEDEPEALLRPVAAALAADASAWVRAEAATALGVAPSAAGERALRTAALEDEAPRVRAAALRALCAFGPDAGRSALAEDVYHDAPSYAVMGAAAALLCASAPERAFEFLLAGLDLRTPHDVLAGHLLRELALLPDPRVPEALRRVAADPDVAPSARAVAVEGLTVTTRERPASSRFLLGLLDEPSFHLRGAVVRALAAMGDAGARRALEDYHPRARTSEERRAIEALMRRTAP